MGTVIMHDVVSVDGFIADENDQPGPLHEWYFGGDTPIRRDQASFDHSGVGSPFGSPGHLPATSERCGIPWARS
jgi:hypothetical protein